MEELFRTSIATEMVAGNVKLGPSNVTKISFDSHKAIIDAILDCAAKESVTESAIRFITQAKKMYKCKGYQIELFFFILLTLQRDCTEPFELI